MITETPNSAAQRNKTVVAEIGTPEYWAARARGTWIDPGEEAERQRKQAEVRESFDRLRESVIAKAAETGITECLGVWPTRQPEDVLEKIRTYATEPVHVSSGNEFGRGYNRGYSTALANILRILDGYA